jgi:hypothetical protein
MAAVLKQAAASWNTHPLSKQRDSTCTGRVNGLGDAARWLPSCSFVHFGRTPALPGMHSIFSLCNSRKQADRPERHTFISRDLLKYWLEPVQDKLVHLKLESTCFWGWIPKCDLRRIQFSKLESLELGEMTLMHDWQLDWIVSHGETLTHLSLRDCPVVHDI